MKPLPFPLDILIDGPAGVIAGLGAYLVVIALLAAAGLAGERVYRFARGRLASDDDRLTAPRRWLAIGAGLAAGAYVALVLFRALQASSLSFGLAILT